MRTGAMTVNWPDLLKTTLKFDANAHRPGRARHDAHCHLFVVRIEVRHLLPGHVAALLPGQGADLFELRVPGALFDAGCALDQIGHERLLHDERVRAVLVDRKSTRLNS